MGGSPLLAPTSGSLVGRVAELGRVTAFVDRLADAPRSLVLIGEAGIGKTTLWLDGIRQARAAGAQVLVTRPSLEDRDTALQGLHDLWSDSLGTAGLPEVLDPRLPAEQRNRAVLARLSALAEVEPVVIAVDDLPHLDDATHRVLRFVWRRLAGRRFALLATARTWSPDALRAPVLALEPATDVLPVPRMSASELRRVVTAALPDVDPDRVAQACDLAHGNPFIALELARSVGEPDASDPLAALHTRVEGLPPAARAAIEVLAIAGPLPLGLLLAAAAPDGTPLGPPELGPAIDAGVLTVDDQAVVRFAHPLIATAAASGVHPVRRLAAHAALATTLTDPDARARHRACATVHPDAAVAAEAETAAARAAQRGAPRRAAELYGHAARLSPADAPGDRVRRAVARTVQLAAAGELRQASGEAAALLAGLPAGPLRAEVTAARVVTDFTDAESRLRAALAELGEGGEDRQRLRGRLLALLGWLLGVHQGRLDDGAALTADGLELGRRCGDRVLIAQAGAAASVIALVRAEPRPALMAEALALGPEVVRSELALWPQVVAARADLWEGRLDGARAGLGAMLRCATEQGAQFQRPYRLVDLALAAIAAGDLDDAAAYVGDAAADRDDETALTWLAHPAGVLAALRGDRETARWCAARLGAAGADGQQPRLAVAALVRALAAAAEQDLPGALAHAAEGLAVLDRLGYRHPGPVPLLPLACLLAALTGDREQLHSLVRRWPTTLDGAPWVDAHRQVGAGLLLLVAGEPSAEPALGRGRMQLDRLGYRLDAAWVGVAQVAAGLQVGSRRAVRTLAQQTQEWLATARVAGWVDLAAEQRRRVDGGGSAGLTATEGQIVALVAEGRRNAEIAARLFVSESTVEAHLTRVYRKLAVRGRTELTRWASVAGGATGS